MPASSDYGTGSEAQNKVVTPAIPTVITYACTGVQDTYCTGNGKIDVSGGENCTYRGFCYKLGTSGDPTTSDSKVYDGPGSYGAGYFSKQITGLLPSTGYRVRAYATNSAGTGYGTTVQVTTLATQKESSDSGAGEDVESLETSSELESSDEGVGSEGENLVTEDSMFSSDSVLAEEVEELLKDIFDTDAGTGLDESESSFVVERVSTLRHIYRPGSYRLEIGFGGVDTESRREVTAVLPSSNPLESPYYRTLTIALRTLDELLKALGYPASAMRTPVHLASLAIQKTAKQYENKIIEGRKASEYPTFPVPFIRPPTLGNLLR